MRRVAGLEWRLALLLAVCLVLAAMAVTASRSLPANDQRPWVQAEQKAESRLKEEKPSEATGQHAREESPVSHQIITGPPSGESKEQAKQGNEEGTESWPSIFGLRLKVTDSLIVLLTALLAIYTRELNKSTIRLWEAGERQIIVANEAAKAANASSKIAQNALVASQRPWIKASIIPDQSGLPPEKWSSLRYGFEPCGGCFHATEEAYG